jgi:6-phosphogluconolactonase
MDNSPNQEIRVLADLAELSRAATEDSLRIARDAVQRHGRCAIALGGGHTPEQMYRLWAEQYREQFPWEHMHLFWGDERYVPREDPHSNYRMVREALLERVSLPAANVHPMPTDFAQPDDAARAYEAELRRFFSPGEPAFDLVFLGLGGEGHTASLFPGSPALAERERWVVAVRAPAEPPVRLSLTLPVLSRARNVFFLVAGSGKQEIVASIRGDPESAARRYPAAMVRPAGPVVWFLDRAAAASA